MEAAVRQVFESQYFILGPAVTSCEEAIARFCGVPHACGVSSGTDALLISLMAEEIGPGDEVITTPYTFFATAGCIARTGAVPVFVDIDPVTFNLVPSAVEAAISSKTKAIIPVHLFGRMAAMPSIMKVAEKHGLVVIEDAAQAIGAACQGRGPGQFGHYACFSFFPSKNLGGAGDGGMVVTRDADRAEHLGRLRNHGMNPKYYHAEVGGNFRLDALQAAVVEVKLQYLDEWARARQSNARRYDSLFREAGLVEDPVQLPAHPHGEDRSFEEKGCRHVFNQYVIRVSRRDDLRRHLQQADIGCEVYYPVPMHRQECFLHLGYGEGSMPESERAAAETLALPIYPELTDDQAAYVVDQIKVFYAG
jgi:dTDP-4-amino-4,6-dideoxygalactose transaminase